MEKFNIHRWDNIKTQLALFLISITRKHLNPNDWKNSVFPVMEFHNGKLEIHMHFFHSCFLGIFSCVYNKVYLRFIFKSIKIKSTFHDNSILKSNKYSKKLL